MTWVLAIESATDAAGVALADDAGVAATVTVGRGRRHAETIAPAVAQVCATAGIGLGALDAVAVDVGPGLFTGLRVGIATAKAVAFAHGLPMVPVASVAVLARAAVVGADPGRPLAAVVDARRGEVFWAWYEATGIATAPKEVAAVRVGPPQALAVEVRRHPVPPLVVGDGAVRYAEPLRAAGAAVAGPLLAHPPVATLAIIGAEIHGDGGGVAPDAVRARYLRDADARINWEQR
jgi:tRNA threonylcarbamoyladenosine biosynthesis protein TsaB